jgi:RNA polymerase sigma-70 factor (ECF subfamily)
MSSRIPESVAPPIPAEGVFAEEVAGLFDRFRAPLLRYLLSVGLPIADGEEILQDVFVALFRHLERGRPLENVRGWLFRVAHNLALKRRVRKRRDAEGGDAGPVVDPEPNPEDRFARVQSRRRMLAAVDALPERDRRCLFLRAEGLRYREIAEVLGMSLGAVSQSLARSLSRIAGCAERSGL